MDDICMQTLRLVEPLGMDYLQKTLAMARIYSASSSDMLRWLFATTNTKKKK